VAMRKQRESRKRIRGEIINIDRTVTGTPYTVNRLALLHCAFAPFFLREIGIAGGRAGPLRIFSRPDANLVKKRAGSIHREMKAALRLMPDSG